MVDLDKTLKSLKPWPEIAQILDREMKSNPMFRDLTVVLRAMTPDDETTLAEAGEEECNGMTADHGGKHFEFAFDLAEEVPGIFLRTLEAWVDVIILDRIDQYLEAREDGDDDPDQDD